MNTVAVAIATACCFLLLRTLLSMKSIIYQLGRWWRWLDDHCQAHQIYNIPRFGDDGDNQQENPLFRKSVNYLSSLSSVEDSDHANIFSSSRKPNEFSLQPNSGQTVSDTFRGARLSWTVTPSCLHLRLRRQDRHRVLRPYLQHVETIAEEMESKRKEFRLYSLCHDLTGWNSIPFAHPSSLDTVAVDPEVKNRLRNDLENFLKGKGYYARLGRVWKRSYLLYGPPGTGKSTFVAAMAKFLCYDVYDLDLSRMTIAHGADLRSLLLKTGPKSVILVEDLDRYLSSSKSKEEMAGMLGFLDGIFSFCGEERVMVFTMSGGKETIDPAILRPGRLDVHVHFPLCDFAAFRTLASSYLGLKDHKLYPQVEEGFQSGAKLSPAEVGEIMMSNRGSPSRALKTVINALQRSSSERKVGYTRKAMSESGRSSVNMRSRADNNELNGERYGYGNSGLGFGKEATVREFKKLFGLIRMRSSSEKEGTMSVEMAAAAAAAANAANYYDRSIEM